MNMYKNFYNIFNVSCEQSTCFIILPQTHVYLAISNLFKLYLFFNIVCHVTNYIIDLTSILKSSHKIVKTVFNFSVAK